MTSESYSELRRLLALEFCADNFREITRISYQEAGVVDRPLGFLTLWSMFYYLDGWWRERPLTDTTGKRMEEHLRPSILSYLQVVESGLSPEVEIEYLNAIATTFRSWVAIQVEIPRGE